MSEDQELQAKIAALSGRISQHKEHAKSSHPVPKAFYKHAEYHGHARGGSSWAYKRGTPYGVPRGRGGRGGSAAHRNRTLIMKSTGGGAANATATAPANHLVPGEENSKWISKVDRHMQLINTAVYDQVSQQRTQAIAETAVQKRLQRDQLEKAKLQAHFYKSHTQPHDGFSSTDDQLDMNTRKHEIMIQGIKFRVLDGGSKLARCPDNTSLGLGTPKQAQVGGVKFFRSKTGNLYRAGLVKATRKQTGTKSPELCPNFTSTGSPHLSYHGCFDSPLIKACGLFTLFNHTDISLGQCSKGPACRFTHNASKVAMCKDFLAKGNCPLGDACDLSHEPNAHRVPACVHFLRGNCTNEHCRYAHVRVNPVAPVCSDFAKIGYCEKGVDCAERHVHECPDYANKGLCRNKKCRLPHVDRAVQLRKAATETSVTADMETSPDLSSDGEEYDSEDFDSDEASEFFTHTHASDVVGGLSQQRDFIKL
ncbi:hypothetical protein EJ05DRAFT_469172 [Pseudovirgaria hyperparasitica]|uniref:C3H1-type domain-containing protein n=1 Tax=Pseudovirgaria hyperparasitica TaxID=470096 RepID=A0A6A6VZ47_9PEZI|nr:uncharacterized protein EJ05DRAFT_469172 [Pseudovirgaria hyperparasitica]KAF2754081.1 hypothetical protein EJ05DRAFT_469172 [Pseudovirgaria hyperparasitica]